MKMAREHLRKHLSVIAKFRPPISKEVSLLKDVSTIGDLLSFQYDQPVSSVKIKKGVFPERTQQYGWNTWKKEPGEEVPAMSTDYLSKDTFEAHMKRMDERAAHSEALFSERMNTMQALMEKSLAEHRAVAEEIKGDVKTLGARLDAMENKSSRNVAWTGIIVGAIAALIQITIAVIK